MPESDVSQYLIHPALKPRLDEWLKSQGLEAVRVPFLDDDSPEALPVYNVQPTAEAWNRFIRMEEGRDA